MLRRFLVFISVLAVALSMIGVSALRASADETPPTLSPAQGPAGTHVTASASDWSGCSSMSVSGWGQTTLGTAAVSSSGAFTLSFTVPGNAALGAAQLVFMPTCSHSTILTVATFTVTQGTPPPASCSPSVSLTPSSGAVGSKFAMAGKGWLPGGTVTVTLPSTASGFFESTTPFTFKAAADGTWQLTAIVGKPSSAGSYTFTYAESGCASKTGTFTVTASPAASVPAAPSNLTATAVDQHDIKLTWHDNSSNETGFEINNGVTSRNTGPNSTTYTWGSLAPGTYMCFKIRAYNSAGDSPWDPNTSPYYVCTTIPKPAPPTSCPAIHFIGFHGTGQSEAGPQYLGMGQTVLATWQALASHGTVSGGMVVSADPFPAVDLPSTNNVVTAVTQGWAYAQVAINAAATATKQIESITAACPKTKFVFVGYSLGALIAHMTLQNLSQAKFNLANVVAVVFFGDPIYPQVKSTSPREGVGRAIGLWSNGAPYVPGNLGNRTLSMCLSYNLRPPTVSKARVAYDPVCMVTTPIKQDVNLKACVAGKTRNSVLCPHTQYVSLGAPKVAATWLAKILNIH